ncbi:MAG: hypothetical protein Q7L55_05745 [Actinomycetota bacterium]|nr:hypothetical protein [Actinomycetota bacterium]
MSDQPIEGSCSVFGKVDQTEMADRLTHSPIDDADIGLLSDRDEHGDLQVSQALIEGIRIFSGETGSPTGAAGLEAEDQQESPVSAEELSDSVFRVEQEHKRAFLLYGPAGLSPANLIAERRGSQK